MQEIVEVSSKKMYKYITAIYSEFYLIKLNIIKFFMFTKLSFLTLLQKW